MLVSVVLQNTFSETSYINSPGNETRYWCRVGWNWRGGSGEGDSNGSDKLNILRLMPMFWHGCLEGMGRIGMRINIVRPLPQQGRGEEG